MVREMLNYVEFGQPFSGPPLIIAHGLFGSARNWGVIAKRLADRHHVVAVDMRNHGQSPWNPDHSYAALADDLATIIRKLGGKAHILGHSMGGKAAMMLALMQPDLVSKLIIADIAPVTYTHTQMPYVAAMQAVDLEQVSRRSEADGQLSGAVPDPALRAFLLQSLVLEDGKAEWRLNLQALADQMPQIMSFPDVGARFDRPVTFLRGGASDYVAPSREAKVKRLFPSAEFTTLDGVGHWLHAEDPRGFEAAVRVILDG